MSDINERNDLQEIIDKALEEMREEAGGELDISKLNLAEFQRKTGLTRGKARALKAKGFKVAPHGRTGKKAAKTVMTGHEDTANALLAKGVTNSSVMLDRLRERGYTGGLTRVKDYIKSHMHLVPAKRKTVATQASRGQRFQTGPGEAYQMDWGFINIEDKAGAMCRIACFVMVCHRCGTCYIEFFPNARQENLFIGMLHAFVAMGVPEHVLTDNMRSVVTGRGIDGKPNWQVDYAAFMACIGFKTRLCKPYHPWTKGKCERLVKFVKGNFAAGRDFYNVTQLNAEALSWCAAQSGRYRRALACVPSEEHGGKCLPAARRVEPDDEVAKYLCPLRRISFDGFVSYEGRRSGVPCWYPGRDCRVNRDGETLHIYSEDLTRELAVHPVTWARADSFCADQYADVQPVELPTQPVTTTMSRLEPPSANPAFDKFDFEGRL